MKFEVQFRGADAKPARTVELVLKNAHWKVILDGKPVDADVVEITPNSFSILLNEKAFEIRVMQRPDGSLQAETSGEEFSIEVLDRRAWRGRHSAEEVGGRHQITAPMPGKIVRVLVKEGEQVKAGQGLLVVEAMKMQNEISSPKNGTVERVHVTEGQAVNSGEILAWVN
jgi:glutaconyl-CoA/methylmalonyl-CoA decarboxylase subunit gamma